MVAADFDYIETRNEIIKDAFEICGVIETSQVLSGAQLAQGVRTLELMVKAWTNKHLFLWNFNQTSFPTVVDQELYTDTSIIDQAIIGLDKAYIVDPGGTQDLPMTVISYSRYLDILTKESPGKPTHIAFKPTPDPTFYLYPSPDAVYTIKALCVFKLQDFDLAAGTADIHVKFQEALLYGLADRLFDKYPGAMNERQFIKNKADEYFRDAKIMDAPVETRSEVEGLF